jgi:hypothetical protein
MLHWLVILLWLVVLRLACPGALPRNAELA